MSALPRVLVVSVVSVCLFHCVRGAAPASPTSDCSTKSADVVFLLDSSGSVRAVNFEKVKKFLEDFVKSVEIGPKGFNIGVITFASHVNNIFWLNTHTTKSSLLQAIARIPYRGGGTRTYLGLAFVRQEAFTEEHGDREHANNILVVVTDGLSTDAKSTAEEASKLHVTDTKVIAVGVGYAVQKELTTIASDKDSVFAVTDFDGLKSIEKDLKTTSCEVAVAPVDECGTLSGDIVFLLDSSGSIGPGNFKKIKEYVKHVAKSFMISPNAVNIGMITFEKKIHEEFWLRNYTTEDTLLEAIERIPYYDGKTEINQALSYARQNAFTKTTGDRDDPVNVLVVISDGQSDNPENTQEEAKELQKSGVIVLGVGVGKYVNESELAIIANGKENVFHLTDFSAVDTLKDKLVKPACKAIAAAPSSGSTRAVAAARRYVLRDNEE